jgi:acetone carboxylase gamma subunit
MRKKREKHMKLVVKEFICPECGQLRWLKVHDICADCRDKKILNEISQARRMHKEILLENLAY